MNKNKNKIVPVGVKFQHDTLSRRGKNGDNWCLTWAADDSQITAMDDGEWMKGCEGCYHHRLYRLLGDATDFKREDILNYPSYVYGSGGWYGYGLIAVDGALYSAVSKTPDLHWSGPFLGVKLLKSEDNGESWLRMDRDGNSRLLCPNDPARHDFNQDEMFFLKESGEPHKERIAYPFSYFSFVQCGKDNSAAQDDYIYIYSPEGAHSNRLMLARAPKKQLGLRTAWEYFTGYVDNQHQWSSDIEERKPAHVFPKKNQDGHYFGWYSWLPSVVWNDGLQLYIMANGGTYGGYGMSDSDEDYFDRWMHTKTGSLGFWYSEHPAGPWHQFFYSDYWTADNPGNLTYQPELSPKWISASGKELVLVWSDAMKNSDGYAHQINYMWNQMTITLELSADR